MFNALGNDLARSVHLNLFKTAAVPVWKQRTGLNRVKHTEFVDLTAQWQCHSFVAVPWCKPGGFTVDGWSSLEVLHWQDSGWECQHGWGAEDTGVLPVSSEQWLCAISCSQPQVLSFLLVPPSSPTDTPPLHFPLFHALLTHPLPAAAAALLFLPATLLLPVPSFLKPGALTPVSLLIPS